MPTPPKPAVPTVTLTQQSLNLIRQIVAAPGWPKSIDDIYLGGKLLVDDLPKLDDLSWLKTDDEVRLMTATQRAAYQKQDEKWTSKEVSFSLTPDQTATIRKAFDHFIETASKENRLGPNLFLNEIIDALGFRTTS